MTAIFSLDKRVQHSDTGYMVGNTNNALHRSVSRYSRRDCLRELDDRYKQLFNERMKRLQIQIMRTPSGPARDAHLRGCERLIVDAFQNQGYKDITVISYEFAGRYFIVTARVDVRSGRFMYSQLELSRTLLDHSAVMSETWADHLK